MGYPFHFPSTECITAKCVNCGKRVDIHEVHYKKRHADTRIAKGFYGVQSEDKLVDYMIETYCSQSCATQHVPVTVTFFEHTFYTFLYCKNGHNRTEENIYVNKKTGQIMCKDCLKEQGKKYVKQHRVYPELTAIEAQTKGGRMSQMKQRAS